MGKYLWMVVEADEYELPIAVAGSAKELAKILGVSEDTVTSAASKELNGRCTGRRYVKVLNNE